MSVLSLLLVAAIKGSVLLALAWIVTSFGMRRASAAARHLVWASAIGGILVLPLISAIVPALPVRGLEVNVATAPAFAPSPSNTATPSPTSTDVGAPAAGVATAREVSGDHGSASIAARQEPAWRSMITRESLLTVVSYLWLIGAGLVLLRVVLGTLRVSQWTRRAQPVGEGEWLALVQRLANGLRIARPVALLRSERACVPMTWGVVYPTVLLPIDADGWNAERRTIVLLHELAHVKRLDAFTQLVAQLAIGVFWFNPLVWIAARAMRAERERACDDLVLQAGARASAYAHDLLEIARLLGSSSAPAAAALAMARRGELEGRLLAILDPKTDRRNVTRARLALATVAVWALVLPLAALAPAQRLETRAAENRESAPRDAAPASTQTVSVRRAPAEISRKIETPPPTPLIAEKSAAVETLPATTIPSLAVPLATPFARPPAARAPLVTVKQPIPDRETLIAVARAARKLTSNHDKAELLITIVEHYIRDDELRTAYLDAVASLTSDYDRTRTLIPLLLKDSLSSEGVAQVVKIAGSMSSSNDKANILVRVATEHPSLPGTTRTALISSMAGFTSDFDRARSIVAISKHQSLSNAELVGLINVTAGMSSSHDKARSLIAITSRYPLADADVRRAFFKAAETISSASDYRRVVSSVLK